jgi:hypothetical protein
MKLPTLYSRTNTGAVQTWTVEIEGDSYRTIHGQLDGKLQTTEWTVCIVTNEGRANERDPMAQAQFEAIAAWDKRVKMGYFERVEDIDISFYVEPMLAKKWEDRKDKVKFPLYSQPKLDGCLHSSSIIDVKGGTMSIQDLLIIYFLSCKTDTGQTPPVPAILPKIKTYNEVTGENEFKSIKKVMFNGIDIKEKNPIWYKITTDTGKELTLTGNHRVWVDNLKCWRRVDELDGTETLKNSI